MPGIRRGVQDTPGLALIEVLVAAALLTIVAVAAFVLFASARRAYETGVETVDRQESLRTAYDRLVSDLRLAGFNHNPDGDPSRTDEQIEGAWDTAITFRGDFDAEDPARRATPEDLLAGDRYRIVSTGNDEIVTYLLAKPRSNGALTLDLDPDRPRSGIDRIVNIPNVAVLQDDPPYTLYRVTLADVAGAFPEAPQPPSVFLYEPIVTGIRSLSFRYYDAEGRLLSPDTPERPDDDLGGGEASRDLRGRIRQIGVRLVRMLPAQARLSPATDVLDLSTMVHAENLGLKGLKDSLPTPPRPAKIRVVAGHCNGILVLWDVPPYDAELVNYSLTYWPQGALSAAKVVRVPRGQVVATPAGPRGQAFVGGLTDGITYCFRVETLDSREARHEGTRDPESCIQVHEGSTPGSPRDVIATGGRQHTSLDSQIELSWDEVRANRNIVEGDPVIVQGATVMRDGAAYKIYRDNTLGFQPRDASNLIATVPFPAHRYIDRDVANCRTYYYRVVAVDQCGVPGQASDPSDGRAETDVQPAMPTGLVARRFTKDTVALAWDKVTTQSNGNPTFVEQYKIYRDKDLVSLDPAAADADTFPFRDLADHPAPAYDDVLDRLDLSDLIRGWHFDYVVTAADRCGNESRRSVPVEISCRARASLSTIPKHATAGGEIVPVVLRTPVGSRYRQARVRISRLGEPDTVVYDHESLKFPFCFPSWDTTVGGRGSYRMEWEAEDDAFCTTSLTTAFGVTGRGGSGIASTSVYVTTGEDGRRFSWEIINATHRDLEIRRIEISWPLFKNWTRRVLAIEYPSGSVASRFPTGEQSVAVGDYASSPLGLPATANGLCGDESCRVTMSLLWNEPTFTEPPESEHPVVVEARETDEPVTVRYYFADATNNRGSAALEIWPDHSLRPSERVQTFEVGDAQ